MKSQKFGVEIEMTGLTRRAAADTLARYFLTPAKHVGGGYDTYIVEDQTGRKWSIVKDSSILPSVSGTNSEEYKVEFVTPILKYEDIETLQELLRALRKAGAKVNSSCGIHIHVDAANHNAKTVRNLINIFASREDILYEAIKVNSGRLKYCKKIKTTLVDNVNTTKPKSLDGIARLWYEGYDPAWERNVHYSSTRYCGLNLHSIWYKGTIEFRLFNSTTHAGELKSYIQLALAMSAQAILQRSASPVKPTTDNPKYTFRCWLLRLGFIGDEFETARHHLLKNLSGNSAWRQAQ